jgi:hypothetical protein
LIVARRGHFLPMAARSSSVSTFVSLQDTARGGEGKGMRPNDERQEPVTAICPSWFESAHGTLTHPAPP